MRLPCTNFFLLVAIASPALDAQQHAGRPEQDRSASAATTRPAASPPTLRTGLSIRGRVTVEQGWSFEQPDLSRVVVYLGAETALDSPSPLHVGTIEMAQRRKAFSPDLLVVRRGTDVEFPNWDSFNHNVFSRSPAAPPFDLERYPYGTSKTVQLNRVGVIHLFCNIHPQMRGIIVVTPNAFFGRADARGAFEFKDVPAGEHEVVAWNERCGEQRQVVRVEDGAVTEVSIVLKEARESVLVNVPPSRGSQYGVERGLGLKRERLDLPVVREAHPAPPSGTMP